MKKVLVITKNRMLFQKIKLELFDTCECTMCEQNKRGYDTVLTDTDTTDLRVGITLGSGEGCDVAVPFAIGSLAARLVGGEAHLSYDREARRVLLGGISATLTEVEGALFEALLEGGGEFVSRRTLLDRVWGEGTSGGVLSVYVHYLREKLEQGGTRVILSSREMGYRINSEVLENA